MSVLLRKEEERLASLGGHLDPRLPLIVQAGWPLGGVEGYQRALREQALEKEQKERGESVEREEGGEHGEREEYVERAERVDPEPETLEPERRGEIVRPRRVTYKARQRQSFKSRRGGK